MSSISNARDLRFGGRWSFGQRLKNDLVYLALRVFLAIAVALPRSIRVAAVKVLAHVARFASSSLRRRIGPEVATALGEIAADTIALFDPDERAGATLAMDEKSKRAFREALDEGRGVVFITAHAGSWERLAALLVEEGFPVATVARESYDPRITALYERLRAPRGVRSIYRGRPSASKSIVRELRDAGAVGFLVDLPGRGVATVSACVGGRSVDLAAGPFRLALARGAAVVVGLAVAGALVVRRVEAADLARDAAGERILVDRSAAILGDLLARAPAAWMARLDPKVGLVLTDLRRLPSSR